MNYYQQFIKGYIKIIILLFELLKKGKEFEWTTECEIVFTRIKEKIITAPILVQYNLDKETTIKTNASDYTIRMRMT